jgi:hypothetical protein
MKFYLGRYLPLYFLLISIVSGFTYVVIEDYKSTILPFNEYPNVIYAPFIKETDYYELIDILNYNYNNDNDNKYERYYRYFVPYDMEYLYKFRENSQDKYGASLFLNVETFDKPCWSFLPLPTKNVVIIADTTFYDDQEDPKELMIYSIDFDRDSRDNRKIEYNSTFTYIKEQNDSNVLMNNQFLQKIPQ